MKLVKLKNGKWIKMGWSQNLGKWVTIPGASEPTKAEILATERLERDRKRRGFGRGDIVPESKRDIYITDRDGRWTGKMSGDARSSSPLRITPKFRRLR